MFAVKCDAVSGYIMPFCSVWFCFRLILFRVNLFQVTFCSVWFCFRLRSVQCGSVSGTSCSVWFCFRLHPVQCDFVSGYILFSVILFQVTFSHSPWPCHLCTHKLLAGAQRLLVAERMLGAPGAVVSSARGLKWTVQVDLHLPVAWLCSRIGDGVSTRIKIFNFHKLWRVESPGNVCEQHDLKKRSGTWPGSYCLMSFST